MQAHYYFMVMSSDPKKGQESLFIDRKKNEKLTTLQSKETSILKLPCTILLTRTCHCQLSKGLRFHIFICCVIRKFAKNKAGNTLKQPFFCGNQSYYTLVRNSACCIKGCFSRTRIKLDKKENIFEIEQYSVSKWITYTRNSHHLDCQK